jgi:hypothetical protein
MRSLQVISPRRTRSRERLVNIIAALPHINGKSIAHAPFIRPSPSRLPTNPLAQNLTLQVFSHCNYLREVSLKPSERLPEDALAAAEGRTLHIPKKRRDQPIPHYGRVMVQALPAGETATSVPASICFLTHLPPVCIW